jgi:ABC-type transporter Mla maintaining outer membrane lipid asymmetry ATPase subunit MlaF
LFTVFNNTHIDPKKEPRELSFGQKKFITNLSFYHNPIIHFFDEPDLGTDNIFNQYLIDYINYRKEFGLISIIVSHNINKYKSIATKHISLN